MNTKNDTIFLVLVISFMLSGCGQKQPVVANNLIEFDPKRCFDYNPSLSDYVLAFSMKYSPDWECGWLREDSEVFLTITSGENMLERSAGVTLTIIPVPYAGEELADLSLFARAMGIRLSMTTINGQDAARAEFTDFLSNQL